MEDIFRHLHVSQQLACQFIGVFSRMEYALKSTRYADGTEKRVDPAWDRFANEVDNAFFKIEELEVLAAIDYLLTHPPRKQTFSDNRITFIAQNIDANQKKLSKSC